TLKIFISRTHRQAVRLTMRGRYDNVNGEIKVTHHALRDGGLLKILGAENCYLGLHNIEEFGHNRGDTAEMSRARPSLHVLRKRFLNNVCAERSIGVSRIHRFVSRRENDVHTCPTA